MKKYIESLIKIGLTELEAKVYIALLKKETFTATEISSVTNINRTQTYDVLAKLSIRGMVFESRGKVKKYSAVDPKNVLNGLVKELDGKRDVIEKLTEPLSDMFNYEKHESESLDFVQVLSSRNNIINKIENLEKSAKFEIISFCKPPYLMNVSASHSKERMDVITNGSSVSQKSIYEIEDEGGEDFLAWIKIFEEAGEEVRVSKKLPIKFVIFDKQKVVCTVKSPLSENDKFTAMFIYNSELADALICTFNYYWNNSMTIEEFINSKKNTEEI